MTKSSLNTACFSQYVKVKWQPRYSTPKTIELFCFRCYLFTIQLVCSPVMVVMVVRIVRIVRIVRVGWQPQLLLYYLSKFVYRSKTSTTKRQSVVLVRTPFSVNHTQNPIITNFAEGGSQID